MDEKTDSKQIWATTAIVAVTTIVIGGILRLIDHNYLNKSVYARAQGYFLNQQPDYFPLLFVLVMFIVTFFIVWVYRMALPNLPANWIYRGILVGGFLFLVGDFPILLQMGYTTVVPSAATLGMIFTDLINRLFNGCILTYTYYRFSSDYQKDKAVQTAAQTKGQRS